MVWVDIAIVVLLVVYAMGGTIRGYRQEAYSVVFWIIGFIVAWFFCQDFAVLLLKVFHSQSARLAASFMALVSITLGVSGIINWLLAGSVKKTRLSFLDRCGGLLAGWVHGMLIVFILVVVAGLTTLPKDRWWQQSKYLPPFQSLAILVKESISTKLASSINYR
jgi:membrane protein required for colicin V production